MILYHGPGYTQHLALIIRWWRDAGAWRGPCSGSPPHYQTEPGCTVARYRPPSRLPPRAHGQERRYKGPPSRAACPPPSFWGPGGPWGTGSPPDDRCRPQRRAASLRGRGQTSPFRALAFARRGHGSHGPLVCIRAALPARAAPAGSRKPAVLGRAERRAVIAAGPMGPTCLSHADARPVHAPRLPRSGQAVKPQKLQFHLLWGGVFG